MTASTWRVLGKVNMSTYHFGLIGFGKWARQAYAPVLSEMSDVKVVAVAARSSATCTLARETFGADLTTFNDYRDLLAEPSIDALMIALPNAMHAQVLQDVAQAEKHVFFEPPMAEDAATAERLLRVFAESKYIVQADLELRYLPVMQAVSRQISSGQLGQPHMAKVRLWCNWGYRGGPWLDEVQGQSLFLWLGFWYLDVLDCIFSTTPTNACVVGGYASNGTLMDHGWASLTYPGHRIGQFEFNLTATQETEIELLLACQDGEIHADLRSGVCRWRNHSRDWQSERQPASEPVFGFEGMREAVHDFVHAIRSGKPPRANLAVIHRVQQAAQLCADAERARL